MRKIFLAGVLLFSALIQAQDMKSVFINMPDSISSLFTKVNRADFADFLESNMRAQVKNKFGNMSEMKTLTKDYLLLESTSSSTLQMKLLPVNDSVHVVCVVNTINGPAADSEISFYSTDWKELPVDTYFSYPSVDLFFQTGDSIDTEKFEVARSKADMNLMKATLSPENETLSLAYTTIDYLDKESAKELNVFLKEQPIMYEWKGNRFLMK